VELVELVVVGVVYTGRGRRVGSAAGMFMHEALRLVKISHNVEEHAEWVHVVQVTQPETCDRQGRICTVPLG